MILIVSFLNLVTTLSQLIAYRNYFLNTFRLKWLEKETKILLKVTKQRFWDHFKSLLRFLSYPQLCCRHAWNINPQPGPESFRFVFIPQTKIHQNTILCPELYIWLLQNLKLSPPAHCPVKYVSWPLVGPFCQMARILTNQRARYKINLWSSHLNCVEFPNLQLTSVSSVPTFPDLKAWALVVWNILWIKVE